MKKIDYKAVAIGTLVDLGATIIFVVFVGLIIGLNSISMPLNLIIGLSCITLGGYVAAKIATMSKLFNATLVGVGGIVLGLPFYSDFPTWYSISSIILMPPSAYLGGIIRLKKI